MSGDSLLKDKVFRDLMTKEEILNMILNTDPSNKGFFWQTRKSDRVIYGIHGTDLDLSKQTVTFNTDKAVDISAEFPVHIKLNPHDFVFKCDIGEFLMHEQGIEIPIPSFGKAIEYRKNPRTSLKDKPTMVVSIRATDLSASLTMELKVYDLSLGGIGLACEGKHLEVLKNYRSFWIERINADVVVNSPVIHFVHLTMAGLAFKAGFRYETALDDQRYDELFGKQLRE